VGFIYQCSVNNNLDIITQESAEISEVSGSHQYSKPNDYVLGFHARDKIIHVFPKGLENFFKNLELIYIQSCQLKEIHQADLKAFPKLVVFTLLSNKIKVIEKGLFDYNPKLEVVGFASETRIIHIDPNVFDNLKKLSNFYFLSVPCIDQSISDSPEQAQEAIKVVKSNCSNSEYL